MKNGHGLSVKPHATQSSAFCLVRRANQQGRAEKLVGRPRLTWHHGVQGACNKQPLSPLNVSVDTIGISSA